MKYSYLKTLGKGAKYLVVYALAFLGMGLLAQTGVADVPVVEFLAKTPLGNLTFGSLLVMLLNHLKVKWGIQIL